MRIFKEYRFEAAHWLPHVPTWHKCKRLHGHSYRLVVHCEGDIDRREGWVVDFAHVDMHVKPLIDALDHRLLNEIDGLENPTVEMIALWLEDKLKRTVPRYAYLELWETAKAGCSTR